MKLEKIRKRSKQSLYGTFLAMTLVPLLLFGLITMLYSSFRLYDSLKENTRTNLIDVATMVVLTYETVYPGDYNVILDGKNTELYKGDVLLSGNYEVLDAIKEKTGVEISIIFYDTRLLTTINDGEGNRFLYSGVNTQIFDDVFEGRQSKFYDNVTINHQDYYSYYQPIFSENGQDCVGMIGVASKAIDAKKTIHDEIFKYIALILLALVITAAFIVGFASKIVRVIKRIMAFLRDLSEGSFYTSLDPIVAGREDEFGEIGKAIIKVQVALRRQIERDPLTGLFNRRSGEKRLDEIRKNYIKYSMAIGDIDFFKKFNDNFGHECGDEVLKQVASVLSTEMHKSGFVVRWGGEEFLLIFENMDELSAGLKTAEILQKVRDNKVPYDGVEHSVTMTFGVVQGDSKGNVAEQINRADERLYRGKQNGRNQVMVSDGEDASVEEDSTENISVEASTTEVANAETASTETEDVENVSTEAEANNSEDISDEITENAEADAENDNEKTEIEVSVEEAENLLEERAE